MKRAFANMCIIDTGVGPTGIEPMTSRTHARIRTVEVTVSSDKWIKVVHFMIGNEMQEEGYLTELISLFTYQNAGRLSHMNSVK